MSEHRSMQTRSDQVLSSRMLRSQVATNQAKPPTVRLRRLAATLRRLREESGLYPRGRRGADRRQPRNALPPRDARSRPQTRTLMPSSTSTKSPSAVRADLLDLAKNADSQGWLRPYQAELPEEYAAYINFENEARAIRNYESLYIPGLLQTEDYARAAITGTAPTITAEEVENRVRARMERQERLTGDSPLEAMGHRGRGGHPPPGRWPEGDGRPARTPAGRGQDSRTSPSR